MNHISLKINSKWDVLITDVGDNYDCVTDLNRTKLLRHAAEVDLDNRPLDNLHYDLIVELAAARRALGTIHNVLHTVAP